MMAVTKLLLVLFLVCQLLASGEATTYVVIEAGGGDAVSLQALPTLAAGDVVQFKGTFTVRQSLQSVVGTAASPITLTSYPGTTAIIDGSSTTLSSFQGMLALSESSYIVVSGLIVRNSDQAGIAFYLTNNTVIQNCTVYNTYVRAIGGCGTNNTVTGNVVYGAVLENSGRGTSGGWSQAVSCDACGINNYLVSDWTFSKNIIYDSYGEGIDCIQVVGCYVTENVIFDTYSVNIYMDNARDVVVDSNYVFSTDPNYYRGSTPATGILVGAETWPTTPVPTINVTIQNNLLYNTNGIANFQETTNYVSNVKIYYNTVWASHPTIFYWPPQPTPPSGNELRNNLFWAINDYSCYMISQQTAWQISNNVWVGPTKVPVNCTDTSVVTSIAVGNYTLIDFSGNVAVTAPYDTAFLLTASSPAVGIGLSLSSVNHDYFGSSRGAVATTVGFAELGTNTASSRGNGDFGNKGNPSTGSSSAAASIAHQRIQESYRRFLAELLL